LADFQKFWVLLLSCCWRAATAATNPAVVATIAFWLLDDDAAACWRDDEKRAEAFRLEEAALRAAMRRAVEEIILEFDLLLEFWELVLMQRSNKMLFGATDPKYRVRHYRTT